MKLSQVKIISKLLFVLVTLTVSSFSFEIRGSSRSLVAKNNLRAYETLGAGASNSTAPASNSTSTGASTTYSKDPSSTAIGAIRNESRVLSAPFKVKNCDQVIEIEGAKTLSDLNDFSKKEDRFFTMSIYMLNEFKKKDSSSLIESISFDKVSEFPQILSGSVGCVKFSTGLRKSIVCLDSEDKANQLITAYKDYQKCRRGEGLGAFNSATITNILRDSCLGLDIKADPSVFGKGDTSGVQLGKAIEAALNKVTNKFRDTLKSEVTKEQLAKERIVASKPKTQ